jgi:NADH-quinone oxidoreductase subunit H
MPSLENIANSIHVWLNDTFSPTWAMLFEFAIVGICIIGLFAMLGLVLIMMERKVSAWMQLRLGIVWGPAECFKLLPIH